MDTINESIHLVKLLQDVMNLFKHNMKKLLGDARISAPQGMVIGLLSKTKKMKVTELSSKLCLSNSTVSGIIDRLEAQEMVIRERSKEDKRVVYVSISPKFEDMHKVFHKQMEKNVQNIINQSSSEELQKISEGLIILKKLLTSQQD
nr:MarR family transcriptional regulator [Clostridium puniceum]